MHLISARAERAYSRSILKRLKMSQTLSSANTFQIHTKNISSDNTHLRFSSHRAHKIEEEIQIYSQPARSLSRAHRRGTGAFCSRRERQDAQFCGDFPLVLLKHIAETTHISASHHAERIKLKKKRVDIYYHHPSRVHFCECTEEEQIGFCSRHERQKFSKTRQIFSAEKWSNNNTTDDDDGGGGASTSKIESILRTTTTTTTLVFETYCENGRIEIWCARSRTRKRFRKSSLESS